MKWNSNNHHEHTKPWIGHWHAIPAYKKKLHILEEKLTQATQENAKCMSELAIYKNTTLTSEELINQLFKSIAEVTEHNTLLRSALGELFPASGATSDAPAGAVADVTLENQPQPSGCIDIPRPLPLDLELHPTQQPVDTVQDL